MSPDDPEDEIVLTDAEKEELRGKNDFDEPMDLTPIRKLTRDLKLAARILSDDEARFLVDSYYGMQRDRIRAAHQMRALGEAAEPHSVMAWLLEQRALLESEVGRALDAYSGSQFMGVWMRKIHGIGPVIAAGLLANIRIEKAPTAGAIWRFAGLDPTVTWAPKTKRPWNGSLKRLCFLIGKSFVKVSGSDKALYGKLYKQRKAIEERKNAAGDFADLAKASLAAKKFDPTTDAYKHYMEGHLPPARIHMRAKRWAVKMFLSHMQAVWWEHATGTKPRAPYIMAKAPHGDYIPPPNWPLPGAE